MIRTKLKQLLLGVMPIVVMCGCSTADESVKSNGITSTVATAESSATTLQTNYNANDFTMKVSDTSNDALSDPLASVTLYDPSGNRLEWNTSDTKQRVTYTCEDYTASVSFSLMTDGVNNQTTVKYLLEVSDKTGSTPIQSSRTQSEIFNGLPDTDQYSDGSASVNKTISSSETTSEQKKMAQNEAKKNASEDDHSDEWGTSTSDDTVCICDECGEEFASTTAWHDHVEEEHDGVGGYHIKSKN